jgi:hypothetical protein
MFATFMYKSDPEGVDDGEDCYCTTNLYFEDHAHSDNMLKLAPTLMAHRPTLCLTVRSGEGKITHSEVISGM